MNIPLIMLGLYMPLALLVGLALVCIFLLPPAQRRGLLPAALTVGIAAAILFIGEWLLNSRGLTWRDTPKTELCLITWLAGLIAGVLTVRYTPRWLKKYHKKLALLMGTLALCCLILSMFAGTVMGGLWAMCPGEQVGTWQGQTVVQGKWTWLGDTSYELYEYHGPLVRGNQSLAWGESPLIDKAGALP